MSYLFQSSIFGNTIGILSLIVGLYSVWITYHTLKKTKSIESQIKETKIHTESKYLLNDYKKIAVPDLTNKLQALEETGFVTNNFIMSLSKITCTILDFSTCSDSESVSQLQKAHAFISTFQDYKDEKQLRSLVNHIVTVINILRKGENISS